MDEWTKSPGGWSPQGTQQSDQGGLGTRGLQALHQPGVKVSFPRSEVRTNTSPRLPSAPRPPAGKQSRHLAPGVNYPVQDKGPTSASFLPQAHWVG